MFDEDLTVFFDTADFATAATYTPYGGTARTINVIKDEADLGGRLDIAATNPIAIALATDISEVAANGQDALVIGSTTYRIKDIEPQGDGATVLLQLEEQ